MSREMKHSGIPWIGEIPKEWELENIGSCLKEVHDLNIDCSEDNALQFKMGTIISKKNGDSKYNPETLESYNKVKCGDIVINGLNLSFDFISMRVGQVRETGVITSAYLTIRPLPHLHSDYVTYLFKGYDVCKALHGMGKGLRQTLSYKEFRKYLIFHPSYSEQQKIASFLDRKCSEIDEMVVLQEKIIEELKAYKQSVITEAVTKGLNPDVPMKDSGIEWIGEIPENWRVAKLSTLFSFKGGYAFDSSEFGLNGNNQVIRIGNVKNDLLLLDTSPVYISDETAFKAQKSKLDKGQILFTMTGTKGKRDYFYTLLLKDNHFSDKKLYLNQRVGCFVEKDNVCAGYYNYLLKDKHILDVIFLYETGTANQGNLGIESIKNTKVQFPPLSEQQSIASYLDEKCSEIDNLISIKQSKIESLKEYKKSIIYEYVTGKKEVI